MTMPAVRCFFAVIFVYGCLGLDPVIDTPMGQIRGTVKVDNTSSIYAFLGIPFAKPPVGDLRFAKSVQYGNFSETFNATEYGPMCSQLALFPGNETMSEDCLTLNVFVPSLPISNVTLPVVVWIYGGGFTTGWSKLYDPTTMVVEGNVVFVTVNYRLGALGFLSTGTSDAPGNYGLWDQHLAIKWVHENIGAFGGDPQSVTVMGESAGAASVGYQSLSPQNRGLFQRIMLLSGAASSKWALAVEPQQYAMSLGSALQCDQLDTLVSCLRTKSVLEILNATLNMGDRDLVDVSFDAVWVPVVDGDFVPEAPEEMLRDEAYLKETTDFLKYDALYNVVSVEGSVLVSFGLLNNETLEFMNSREIYKSLILPKILDMEYGRVNDISVNILHDAYWNWLDSASALSSLPDLLALVSDFWFVMPSVSSAMKSATGTGSTYYSYMNHVPEFRSTDLIYGTGHAEDLLFIFDFPEEYWPAFGKMKPFSPAEMQMAEVVKRYITNFAHTGNPNYPVNSSLPTTWPKFDAVSQNFIKINTDMTQKSIDQRLLFDKQTLWNQILPKTTGIMVEPCVDKECPTTVEPDTCECDDTFVVLGYTYSAPELQNIFAALISIAVIAVVLTLFLGVCLYCQRTRKGSNKFAL